MTTSPLPPDPYKVLNVAKDATIANIKTAYRKLVLTAHPDKFPDEAIKAKKAEEFHQVQQAYEILSDDERRKRYDQQIRLAELRAERVRETFTTTSSGPPPSRRQEPVYSPRPTPERSWTTQTVYEEIRPRFYEEPTRAADPRSSPRYDDYRPRRYDSDYDDYVPAHGVSKKTASSARPTESRSAETSSTARKRWHTVASKATEKQREKEAEERKKSRDKNRRDDGQSKRQHTRIPVETTDSGTDSEVDAFMKGAYRHTERPRSYEDDKHRSRRKQDSRQNSPERDPRVQETVRSAAEYIKRSINKGPIERDSRRRPSLSRGASSSRRDIPPPPPPPPMPPVPVEVNKPTARRGGIFSSSKSAKSTSSRREPPEIVEPRKHDYDAESRRPELKTYVTSPSPSKPPRSATLDSRPAERTRAPVRRSATSPLAPTPTSHSHKSSKLRESHDSGYSSPGTPDVSTPRTKTTTYKIAESESDSENGRSHYVFMEPDRHREHSPRTTSHRSERGNVSSRHAQSRSYTADQPTRRPATLGRAATERPEMLFGEVRGSPDRVQQYATVRHSPKIGREDISFGTTPRRTPPSDRDSRQDHRDAYGYAERRGSQPISRPARAQEV